MKALMIVLSMLLLASILSPVVFANKEWHETQARIAAQAEAVKSVKSGYSSKISRSLAVDKESDGLEQSILNYLESL